MKKTIVLVLALALGLTMDVAKADFTFGTPTNVGPNVNTASGEGGWVGLSISADGLSLYFDCSRSGGYGSADLWVTTRATTSDDWDEPVNLGPVVNSSARDSGPSISADGLSLYFSSNRPGAVGGDDLWVATRETTADDWGAPSNLGPVVNSSDGDYMSYISVDGLSLYFSSTRSGGLGLRDLWMTTRATTDDEWGEPVNLGPTVNTASNERRMWISSDGLMLLFQSDRPRTSGYVEIYMTTRATTNDDWTEPVKLGPPVSVTSDISPIVSSDGHTLYFSSYNRDGGYGAWDLWQVSIEPIVDFNGDGAVDGSEVCTMADRWGTDDPVCDIGPMPWGDGTVDVQDLIVLAHHIGLELNDPTLIAHWALDEAEGIFASDSAGEHDGTVMGAALWQPAGGVVDGALRFNGTYFVTTSFVLDPSEGPFSASAWVKGGAPGQGIVSQMAGANWLMTDPSTGALMTELASGEDGRSLCSEILITDGNWHRVVVTSDGSTGVLYVDGVLAAEGVQDPMAASSGTLSIGCGPNMAPASFFSGLIDGVRIYNRAVKP